MFNDPRQNRDDKVVIAAAFEAGCAAWREVFSHEDEGALEYPRENPYGDEWRNPVAQAFRSGFNAAARKDGYTYSRVDGEYHEGGEFETDDFTPASEQRELS